MLSAAVRDRVWHTGKILLDEKSQDSAWASLTSWTRWATRIVPPIGMLAARARGT